MSLIDYTNLEDGTPITANIFNERFGQIIAVLNGGLDQNNFAAGGIPAAALADSVFEKILPVGSLYFNATDITNPNELLGYGTWIMYAAGRVPVGYDATDTDFNGAEKTGGAKTTTLTTAQLPSHTHSGTTNNTGAHAHNYSGSNLDIVTDSRSTEWSTAVDINAGVTSTNGSHAHEFTTNSVGSGEGHSNLSPFITVYIWKRTA